MSASSFALRDSIVIEPGSDTIKVSFSDHQRDPDVILRSFLASREVGADNDLLEKAHAASLPVDSKDGVVYFLSDDVSSDLSTVASHVPKELNSNNDTSAASTFTIKFPISQQDGTVQDWPTFTKLIQYILTHRLHVRRARNDYPLLWIVPPHWSKSDYEQLTQFTFEIMNAPGIYIATAPLMAVYGIGLTNGVVVDVGHNTTSITPVLDNNVLFHQSQTIALGMKDVEAYLHELLKSDEEFMRSWGSETLTMEDVRLIKESGVLECYTAEPTPLLQSAAKTKRVNGSVVVKGVTKSFSIGAARSDCMEILFKPSLLPNRINGDNDNDASSHQTNPRSSLPEVISHVIQSLDVQNRLLMWDTLILTGGGTHIKSLPSRLESSLSNYISATETSSDLQAKEVRIRSIPEYFTYYKTRPWDVAFLGGIVVSKLVFQESKNFLGKDGYNSYGPGGVHRRSVV